jgi:plastocyanin
MKRSIIGFLIAGVAVFALATVIGMKSGESNKQSDSGTQTQNQNPAANTPSEEDGRATNPVAENEVAIKDFAFSPQTLTVKKGTTLTWTNQDTAKHTVTPDQPGDILKGSELLGQGETYRVTFTEAGTYTYFCEPHPYMKGTIEVTE